MAQLVANPVTEALLASAVAAALGAVGVGSIVGNREVRRHRQYMASQRATLPGQLRSAASSVARTAQAAKTAATVAGVVAGTAAAKKAVTRNEMVMAEKKSRASKIKTLEMAKPAKSRKKSKKTNKAQDRKENTLVRLGPGISVRQQRTRVSGKGIIPVANNVAGQSNRVFLLSLSTHRTKSSQLGCLFGNAANDMAFSGIFGAMGGLYRKWRLVSLEIVYRSYVTSSSSGVFYGCYDDNPSTGLTGQTNIMNRYGSCMQDYKRDCRMVWKPTDEGDRLPRFCQANAEVFNDANVSYGAFVYVVSNDQGVSAPVGNFEVNATIEFIDSSA